MSIKEKLKLEGVKLGYKGMTNKIGTTSGTDSIKDCINRSKIKRNAKGAKNLEQVSQ